jgi:HK97 gp10 family phage protein
MRLEATAIYKPRGDLGRYVEVHIVPGVRTGVVNVCQMVESIAKMLAPVDTGALQGSIHTVIEETAKTIVGRVGPNVPYAAFVEFGTGIAGASSAGAGAGPYTMTWPGMPAQPYMRPAVDEARQPAPGIIGKEISVGLR